MARISGHWKGFRDYQKLWRTNGRGELRKLGTYALNSPLTRESLLLLSSSLPRFLLGPSRFSQVWWLFNSQLLP